MAKNAEVLRNKLRRMIRFSADFQGGNAGSRLLSPRISTGTLNVKAASMAIQSVNLAQPCTQMASNFRRLKNRMILGLIRPQNRDASGLMLQLGKNSKL